MTYLIGLSLLLLSGTSHAEILPGVVGIKHFEIRYSGTVVGHLVVVAEDNTSPPTGYSAGKEYWTWTSGPAWRGAFTLVPNGTVPAFGSYTWTVFPHERFDLSGTVPFPSISPDVDDGFWKVEVDTGSSWVQRGYMWLIDGFSLTQEWYGVNLTHDLIGTGSASIRFTADEPPSASSIDVYLLD